MIDEKELIELIKRHKKETVCDNKLINDIYGMAHDHIIDIIKILALPTRLSIKKDRCVICGDFIPEGRQICPNCERSGQ